MSDDETSRRLGRFSYLPTRDALITARVFKLGIHRPVLEPRGQYQLDDETCRMIDDLADRILARRAQADRLLAACKAAQQLPAKDLDLRMPGMGIG